MTRRRGGVRIATAPGVRRGPRIQITVDGRPVPCFAGESVAAAMIAVEGDPSLRTTSAGDPRGLFCGMGVCYECVVVVDGVPQTRACMTWVRDGMAVQTQVGSAPRGPAA